MADVTDPPSAGRGWIRERADWLDSPTPLQVGISARKSAGSVVVALSGELDATNAAHTGALITTVAVCGPGLVVNLAGLEFIDCAGMRALAAAHRQARQAGGGLVLAAPAPQVLRALDLTGLTTGVPVCSA